MLLGTWIAYVSASMVLFHLWGWVELVRTEAG